MRCLIDEQRTPMKTRIRLVLVLLLSALFVAACATAPRLVWFKAGATAVEFEKDFAAARAHAAAAPIDRGASSAAHLHAAQQTGKAAVGANIAWATAAGAEQVAQQRNALESFLAGRGWRKVAIDSLTAAEQASGFADRP